MLSLVLFFFITGIYINYNPCWVDLYCINLLGYYFYFYIDSIAVSFILLTGFFIILALLFILNTNAANRIEYMCCIVSIGVLLVLVFSTTHLLLFYVYFESILIPFFFLIGIYGTKSRRVHASYVFFFYTIIGSIWMLIGIVYVYTLIGSFDILVLSNSLLTEKQEHLLWFLFFLGFSVKIPIVPFHIWLPEAHVEAPTEASVLLAALLLKIGTYGLYRIVLVPFTNASFYYCNFLILLNLISMVHASLVALRQIDIKKIIAYSSIAHINICVIGLVSFNTISVAGSFVIMIGHGFISGGLFFMIGMLYNRFKSKIIIYYTGLASTMPIFSFFFFFFYLAILACP